jgi:hypothetical protein
MARPRYAREPVPAVEADTPADPGITMATLLPTGQHPLMTFRIGHPTATALRSPRRPADHALLR